MTRPRTSPEPEASLLRALHELGRVTLGASDPRALAAAATDVLRRCLSLDYVSMILVDADRGLLEYLGHATDFDVAARPGDTQELSRGLVGLCAREGRTVYVEDVRSDPHYVEIIPGAITELAVPIRAYGRTVGVLNCESREPGSLRERGIFLEVVANRLGVAMENARLLREQIDAREQAQRQARQLEVLNQIARIATLDLRMRPMLQRITDALSAAFGWEFIACATVDRERKRFLCEAVTSHVPTEVYVGYGRSLGSGVVGEVAKTGLPILLDDVRTHANYVETMPGALSELCVPVKAPSGRVIAVINLESRQPGAFHDQLPLLETVAEQVAGVINGAALFENLQRRADYLQMMSELTQTAMEAADLGPLLERVVEYVHQRMGLPFVAILLLDETGEQLELVAHAGPIPLTVQKGARWPVTQGVIGRAVRLGKPQIVRDTTKDPDFVPISPEIQGEFAIPIRFGGRTLGVINVEVTSPDAFTNDTVLVLRTFVDQVAGAIHLASINRRLAAANRTLTDLFGRYVAPDLAEQLLADPERFHTRGERREATVLFADIRGFTLISQRLESERLLALLNELLPSMAEAVFAHRGSINRFLGDGFMAVFGVPEKMADHAAAAVNAALEIQRRADAFSPRWQEATGEPLRVVTVANAGEVIMGSVGGARHREFTVLGDVVNVASRVEAEAKARNLRVLVTGAVADAAQVPVTELGEVELRGREGKVRICGLL